MRLIGYDRIIESELPVPGAVHAEGAEPDLFIRTLAPARAGAPNEPLYRMDGSILAFSPPGVGTYFCGSREIAVRPLPGVDSDQLVALLIATALPAFLWMDGAFVLHAAAVRLAGHDHALALAGPSGIGKSTLAAALVREGAELVADDTVRLGADGEGAIASGLPGGWFTRANGRIRFESVAARRSLRHCRLGAIVILSPAAGHAGAPERLGAVAAVEALLGNRHRPRVPAILGKQLETLRFCSFLAGAVPVYIWNRTDRSARIGGRTLEMLERCMTGGDC